VRIHFVNENIGGHATMHAHVRSALVEIPEVEATFFEVPPRRAVERLLGARVPGLASLDLDLQPLRAELARSAIVRRHLSGLIGAPDALHIYTQNAALLSVDHMRRTPTVISTDATNRQNAYLIPARRPTRLTPLTLCATLPFERRALRAARRVLAHSRWAADSILTYGVDARNLEVVPFGITAPASVAARPDRRPRILFVGRSMERKGGRRLLSVWETQLAASSELTLVTLDYVAPQPGLEVRNDVRPGDGKLDEILRDSDIFALPTDVDTFGYAILEAMAAGLAVVAPRHAAIPELVVHGATGLIVPPHDDAELAAALARLVSDRDLRVGMGMAGRKRVLERFDARRTTAQLIEALRDVIA
jgi:alpha-maltose-1-phosphate synthase